MPTLKVNSKIFNYPDQGKEPNTGKVQADWAKEVSAVLESAFGPGTIFDTTSLIENGVNEVNAKSVAGLIFNANLTQSATVEYRIYRKSQNTTEKSEQGTLHIKHSSDPINRWTLTREITNGEPALVYFDIDNTGQVKYWSSDILVNTPTPDSNYEGYVRFKSSSIIK